MKNVKLLVFLFFFTNQYVTSQVHSCIDIVEDKDAQKGAMNGVFSEHSKWSNGSVIKVKFSGGVTSVRQKVEKYARIWEDYANITFNFIQSGSCDILITFQQGKGSWSFVGKQSRLKAQSNEASMNFGWFNSSTPDSELKRTTLHEFGHALGLFHEHINPDGEIHWNKPVVYNYYMSQGWSADKINQNIFGKYSLELSNRTYDKYSIMHYPIPKEHTIDGYGVDINYDLSSADKKLIAEMYPKSRTTISTSVGTASVNLKDIDVNYNVTKGGTLTEKGLEILLNFDISSAKGKECRAVAYFYYSEGKALKDFNSSYCSKNGNISSGSDFTPSYENSTYTDFKVFIPYSELHMNDGEHELKFTVCLWDDKNQALINSGAYYFTYSKGAIVDNLKLSTNTEHHDNKMFLMPKFTIRNAEGSYCKACAYFYDANKVQLKDAYGNNLVFCKDFIPGYSSAVYNSLDLSDLYIDVPYNSIPVPVGISDVNYFVGIFNDGKQIATSDWKSIQLSR